MLLFHSENLFKENSFRSVHSTDSVESDNKSSGMLFYFTVTQKNLQPVHVKLQ
jgi:hypothetical protein